MRLPARMRPPPRPVGLPAVLEKWDLRFLLLAKVFASFSKDPNTHVGAAVARPDWTVAGLGFNGLAPGVDDARIGDRDFKLACVLHAEENAILDARDPDLRGTRLYIWGLSPCAHCVAVALRRGVGSIVSVQMVEREDWRLPMQRAAIQCVDAGVDLRIVRPAEVPELAALPIPRFD